MRHVRLSLLFLLAVACAGTAAREALLTPLSVVWSTEVEPLVRTGATPTTNEAADRFGAALASGIPASVNYAEWVGVLRPAAELAVAAMVTAGELGPNGAGSFATLLQKFEDKLRTATTPASLTR